MRLRTIIIIMSLFSFQNLKSFIFENILKNIVFKIFNTIEETKMKYPFYFTKNKEETEKRCYYDDYNEKFNHYNDEEKNICPCFYNKISCYSCCANSKYLIDVKICDETYNSATYNKIDEIQTTSGTKKCVRFPEEKMKLETVYTYKKEVNYYEMEHKDIRNLNKIYYYKNNRYGNNSIGDDDIEIETYGHFIFICDN